MAAGGVVMRVVLYFATAGEKRREQVGELR